MRQMLVCEWNLRPSPAHLRPLSLFPHSSRCDHKHSHQPSSSKERLWMGFLHREHVSLPHPTRVAETPGGETPAPEKPPPPTMPSQPRPWKLLPPFSQPGANAKAALPSKLSPKTAHEREQPPPCPLYSCSPVPPLLCNQLSAACFWPYAASG